MTPQLLGILPSVVPELVSPMALEDSSLSYSRVDQSRHSYLVGDVFSSRATLGATTVPELSYGSTTVTTEQTSIQTQSSSTSSSTSLPANQVTSVRVEARRE